MEQKKYYFQLAIITIGALLLSFGLSQLNNRFFSTSHYWIPTLFFVITNVGANILITMGDKDSKEFVFKTLAMSMARLLLCMVAVLIYSVVNKPNALAFSCHFMLQYLFFTIFEISHLLKLIKK